MARNISAIFLFTDFGWQGPYLAQMEAAILWIAPTARVINLQSDAPLTNPRAAGYLLAALANQLPDSSLVVAVVDPGVGGDRQALLVESGGRIFIGPDNGLLSRVIGSDLSSRVASIPYDSNELSASFHGRDLFAPVAARFFNGSDVEIREIEKDCVVGADWEDDLLEVIYQDRFGNLFTGIRADSVLDTDRVIVSGWALNYARTFCDVPEGTAFWYRNSCGLVEIAVNQKSAGKILGVTPGSAVSIAG